MKNPLFQKNLVSGFEPTYKELKLSTFEGKLGIVKSFEPTYKELKLGLTEKLHPGTRVF